MYSEPKDLEEHVKLTRCFSSNLQQPIQSMLCITSCFSSLEIVCKNSSNAGTDMTGITNTTNEQISYQTSTKSLYAITLNPFGGLLCSIVILVMDKLLIII